MEIVAKSKYVRISPQKVREVIDAIKNFSPQEALVILEHLPKKAAEPLTKTIKNAMANAKNNFHLPEGKLRVKKIEVSAGPTIKRYQAVSRGRAHEIKKRTSHITVVLEGESGTKG